MYFPENGGVPMTSGSSVLLPFAIGQALAEGTGTVLCCKSKAAATKDRFFCDTPGFFHTSMITEINAAGGNSFNINEQMALRAAYLQQALDVTGIKIHFLVFVDQPTTRENNFLELLQDIIGMLPDNDNLGEYVTLISNRDDKTREAFSQRLHGLITAGKPLIDSVDLKIGKLLTRVVSSQYYAVIPTLTSVRTVWPERMAGKYYYTLADSALSDFREHLPPTGNGGLGRFFTSGGANKLVKRTTTEVSRLIQFLLHQICEEFLAFDKLLTATAKEEVRGVLDQEFKTDNDDTYAGYEAMAARYKVIAEKLKDEVEKHKLDSSLYVPSLNRTISFAQLISSLPIHDGPLVHRQLHCSSVLQMQNLLQNLGKLEQELDQIKKTVPQQSNFAWFVNNTASILRDLQALAPVIRMMLN